MPWIVAWVILTATIVAARREVLRDPPTWDLAARGLWLEASFLADTNFDYARLRDREQSPIRGGAKVYMTSLLPSLLALVMRRAREPSDVFLVYHVFTMASGAAVLVMTFALARPAAGPLAAGLAAGLVLATPLFSAQMDLLGMELPMVACALGGALATARERFASATLLATLGTLIKFSGVIVSLALVGYLLLAGVSRWARGEPGIGRVVFGLAFATLGLAAQVALFRLGGFDHELIRATGL